MGRYFEKLYRIYRENINIDEEKELKKIAEEHGLGYDTGYVNDKEPVFGDIYLFYYRGMPVYYLFVENFGEYKKVLKVSDFWRLANQNDLIVEIDGEKWAVETWNTFYIDENQFRNSRYIGNLSEKDANLLKDFLLEKINSLPPEKRGLTVPEGDYSYYQNRFHRDEALAVKDLALRVLDFVEDILIELPPEKLAEQPLAAGEQMESFIGNNFVLFADRENKLIILEPESTLVGKSAVLKIFDVEHKIESLPSEIYLKLPDDVYSVNLQFIGKNISIEVRN
ncbi:hypothetical protein [Persephonella sp.]